MSPQEYVALRQEAAAARIVRAREELSVHLKQIVDLPAAVRRHPRLSTGAAATSGFVLGRIIRRRMPRGLGRARPLVTGAMRLLRRTLAS